MNSDKKEKDFARKLVALSVVDGQLSQERVAAVLESLSTRPPRPLRRLLKLYRRGLFLELRRSQAVVEHAGELNSAVFADLERTFSEQYGRRITVESRSRPDLIAGIRVRVGDDVYDSSISGRLAALSASIN